MEYLFGKKTVFEIPDDSNGMTIITWCWQKIVSAYAICKRVMCCLENGRESDETAADVDVNADYAVHMNISGESETGVLTTVFFFF